MKDKYYVPPFWPQPEWFKLHGRKLRRRLKKINKRIFGWLPCYFCKMRYADEEVRFHKWKIFPICHICWTSLKDPRYTPKKLKRFHEKHRKELDEWCRRQKKEIRQ